MYRLAGRFTYDHRFIKQMHNCFTFITAIYNGGIYNEEV